MAVFGAMPWDNTDQFFFDTVWADHNFGPTDTWAELARRNKLQVTTDGRVFCGLCDQPPLGWAQLADHLSSAMHMRKFLSNIMRLTDYNSRFLQAIYKTIAQQLTVVPNVDPDPAWRDHADRVLQRTSCRELRTRARVHASAPPAERRSTEAALLKLLGCCQELLAAANGSWVQSRVTHYCSNDGCNHLQQILEPITKIFHVMYPRVVAENRWDSVNRVRSFVVFL